ncbi:uncharacterized protein KD926_005972 [Aspergillus affinis]|uniref:uncharacterized protein n=1 Tax=Aspergillus affinis TaxID=1070780 RepID=UPI0022FEB5C9|nr:uncharacterized protein KD926_005972 [Aspergillus affinis]KAI9046025.1 hypothetical protein KD926_005972 [Aspergillus affinis]
MRVSTSVLLGLLAANVSIAAKVGKFDADKCADPSGMKTCYDKAKSTYDSCVKKNCDKKEDGKTTSDPDCLNKCSCPQYQAQIDCATSSCWNQVYSCEYDLTVGALLESCEDKQSVDDIPFWPAPDNAKGACSCNVGKVDQISYGAMAKVQKQCGLKASSDGSKIQECACCGLSAALSALPNTCPKVNPADLKLADMEEEFGDMWEQCADTLKDLDCAKEFDFPKLDTYYGPGKIPKGGNETLSNASGSLTAPVSATITWSAGSSAHTVTAVSTDAVKASGTGSSASATSGDKASGTASASATATTGAAVRAGMDSYLWAGLAVAAVFVQA